MIFTLVIFCSLLVNEVSAEIEKFSFTIGPGRRDGEASLTVQPNFDAKQTYADFQTRQVGVNTKNRVRVAVQWVRHSNNDTEASYDCVVFQLRVPVYGTTYDHAVEKVLVAKDYKDYRAEGGRLNIDEYIDLVLLDEDLTVTKYTGAFGYIINESKIVTGDFVNVVLNFQAPYMDMIGESKVWYRWVFFNNETKCSETGQESTCLSVAPIDGDLAANTYTTFFTWLDFYKMGDIYTFMWLMVAASVFAPFSIVTNTFLGLIMQIFIFIVGLNKYREAETYANFEMYETEITNMLALSLGIVNITCTLFAFYTAFPVVGPLVNLALVQFVPTELARLKIPLAFTFDRLT